MPLILQPHPQWSPEDKDLARQFMASTTWMKMLEMVMAARPKTEGDTWEKRAIGGVTREAIEDTINAFAQIPNFDKVYAPNEEFKQIDISRGMGVRERR